MSKNRIYNLLLALLILITLYVRFSGLGFSHFYGDETKTFFLDKTLSILTFLFNQRKAPIQFLVVWFVEKITGGHDELYTRIPFAIAGTLSVGVFYLYILKRFNNSKSIALFSTFLFSMSGFFVAFSRTAQYQSFLILFAFLSLLFWERNKYIFSGIFMGLAFLCHYDAVFFMIPIIISVLMDFKDKVKHTIPFAISFILVSSVFYVPYVFSDFFKNNTLPYILKRASGHRMLPNNSVHTYRIYNPNPISLLIFSFSIIPLINLLKNHKNSKRNLKTEVKTLLSVYSWFLVPFILFEFVFSNPGTHTYNYFIPLIILSSAGIINLSSYIKNRRFKLYYAGLLALVVAIICLATINTFVPRHNNGYPWNTDIKKGTYQIYLYGFPYNKGWDQARDFIKAQEKYAENFYTNDNVTIGEYYLFPTPAYSAHPKYNVYILNSQEFRPFNDNIFEVFDYEKISDIYVSGEKTMEIYKRGEAKVNDL